MNSIKLLHCGDVHIGAVSTFLGAKSEKRRFETLITFENIIDFAAEHQADIIAIAGDLFDSNTADSQFCETVLKKISSVPNIKVVYCAGNHDPLNMTSPFYNRKLPENFYILPTFDSCFTFEDIKTRVYGRSFETSHLQGENEFSLNVADDGFINIMVQHGELKSDTNGDYNSITPHFIKTSCMDYIALGHIHKCTPIGKIDSVSFAYCGCPEGQGFDELDEKGFYFGEVKKGDANLKFIPFSKRKYIHKKIDITDVDDITTHILSVIKSDYENFADNLYKIELIGSLPENFNLNIAEITTRLSEYLYFVKITDSTEYTADFETLAKETSLKGIFVKNMLEKIKLDPTNKTLKKALKIGIKAFNGEVKYNEN